MAEHHEKACMLNMEIEISVDDRIATRLYIVLAIALGGVHTH